MSVYRLVKLDYEKNIDTFLQKHLRKSRLLQVFQV